jgi:hypothetical protein
MEERVLSHRFSRLSCLRDLQLIHSATKGGKSAVGTSFLSPVLLQRLAVCLHFLDIKETLGFGILRVGETVPLCKPLVNLVLIPKLLVAKVALSFTVQRSESKILGSGHGGIGFTVYGLRFTVLGSESKILGLGNGGLGFRILGSESKILGSGHGVFARDFIFRFCISISGSRHLGNIQPVFAVYVLKP